MQQVMKPEEQRQPMNSIKLAKIQKKKQDSWTRGATYRSIKPSENKQLNSALNTVP